jgi:hypothetical protein
MTRASIPRTPRRSGESEKSLARGSIDRRPVDLEHLKKDSVGIFARPYPLGQLGVVSELRKKDIGAVLGFVMLGCELVPLILQSSECTLTLLFQALRRSLRIS